MLVVDLMHEFELGVWKALFIHLLRILAVVNPNLLHELDHRYGRPSLSETDCANNLQFSILDIGRYQHSVATRSENLCPIRLS